MEAEYHAVRPENLGTLLSEQARQLHRLNAQLEEFRAGSRGRKAAEARELGYRFDAYPKWLEASGWKEQGPEHRRTWPLLRRFLELERWTGAPVRFTLDQLADYLCCSRDTARRRLRELERLGTISHTPGKGRDVSIAKIAHPIETPVSYSEVPWAQGGLAGAPEGYLEGLSGPKRRYAELYGVELPAEEEPPPEDPDDEESPTGGAPEEPDGQPDTGGPEEDAGPGRNEPAGEDDAVDDPGHAATPEVALCDPFETRDTHCSPEVVLPSDAREEGDRTADRQKNTSPIEELEEAARGVSPENVGQEAIERAGRVVAAFGDGDTLLAMRAAQLSEHLQATGRQHLLDAALPRIRRCAGNTKIVYPIRYLIATLLDIEKETTEDPGGHDLGRRVLEEAGATAEGEGPKDFTEGFEWFFDKSVPPEVEEERRRAKEEKARREAAERWRGFEWLLGDAGGSESARTPEPPLEGDTPPPGCVPSDPQEAWRAIVADFLSEGDPGVRPGLFDSYEGHSLDGGVLTIAAPSPALRDAVVYRFGSELGRLWRSRAGAEARILVGVLASGEEESAGRSFDRAACSAQCDA
jgi:DNA-binding Lrp family transcriptional regulator